MRDRTARLTRTTPFGLAGLSSPGTVTGAVLFGSVVGNFSSFNIINNPNTYSVSVVFTATGMNLVILACRYGVMRKD